MPERIIIIDDEQGMGDSLRTLLQGEGFEVQSFQVPEQALAAMHTKSTDLIITDIKMPQMDGVTLLRQVKAHDDIPVIMMTGFGSLETAIDAISHGAYDYLLKPVEFPSLLLAVNRALDLRRSELQRRQLLEELRINNVLLERRVGELNALYEAGKSIGSTANLNDLLRQIVALAANVTEAQVGSIMLLDERRQFLRIAAAIGLQQEIVRNTRLPIGASIAGYVAKTGEAVVIENVENDHRFRRLNNDRYGPASLLSVPLRIKNSVLGVINMANKVGGTLFSAHDLRILTTFASQAAVAVDDANQFERNRRRLAEFEALQEIAARMPGMTSISQFRNMLVEQLRRVFPIDYAIWFHWESSSQSLIPDGIIGTTDFPLTESGKIDLRRISRDEMAITAIPLEQLNLNDLPAITAMVGEKIAASPGYPHPEAAYLAIPILRNDELAYLFYVGAAGERGYTDDDVALARLVVSQAALLFEKEKALLNATRLITMGNMISEISHDLRKPLTAISGGLQILRQRWPDQAESSDLFKTAEEEIQRMNELVRELVDFSNPTRYETSAIDLRTIIQRALDLLGPDLRAHAVTTELLFEDLNWELIANKNQILELFLNLFMNALDAMPGGGRLTIVGKLETPAHKHDPYLAVKVIDTGIGISPDNLARIFDRYYTTKETGTGLGLVVVERIISTHGGTLAVDSADGVGTTFTVYFPTRS